ncbi:hypothetical protein P9112_007494 [Eukaryota sp. TZLM1-RC]
MVSVCLGSSTCYCAYKHPDTGRVHLIPDQNSGAPGFSLLVLRSNDSMYDSYVSIDTQSSENALDMCCGESDNKKMLIFVPIIKRLYNSISNFIDLRYEPVYITFSNGIKQILGEPLLKRLFSQVFPTYSLRLESECIASTYQHFRGLAGHAKYLVFDWGYRDLKFSVVDFNLFGKRESYSVNHSYLSGSFLLGHLVDHFCKVFDTMFQSNIIDYPQAVQRIRKSCSELVKGLSRRPKVCITLDSLLPGKDFDLKMTRKKFNELFFDFFTNMANELGLLILEYNIRHMLIAGGFSNLLIGPSPCVLLLNQIHDLCPIEVLDFENPETILAQGAVLM